MDFAGCIAKYGNWSTGWLSTARYNNANMKMMNDVWSMLPFVVWFVTVFGSLWSENDEKSSMNEFRYFLDHLFANMFESE